MKGKLKLFDIVFVCCSLQVTRVLTKSSIFVCIVIGLNEACDVHLCKVLALIHEV